MRNRSPKGYDCWMIWKTLLGLLHPLFWILLVFSIVALMGWVPDRRTAKVSDDGSVEFVWNWSGLSVGVLFLLWLRFALVDLLKYEFTNSLSDLVAFTVTLCGLVMVADLPGTIVVNSDGLEQNYWFRGNKQMFWVEVDTIDTGYKSRNVTVTGANGTRIVHSSLAVDRNRFLFEIKRHMGWRLPPEFPREPGPTR